MCVCGVEEGVYFWGCYNFRMIGCVFGSYFDFVIFCLGGRVIVSWEEILKDSLGFFLSKVVC